MYFECMKSRYPQSVPLVFDIDSKSWDNRKVVAKGSKEDIKTINNYLETLRRSLGNIYQQMQFKGLYVTDEAVKDAYFIQTFRFTNFQIYLNIIMRRHLQQLNP